MLRLTRRSLLGLLGLGAGYVAIPAPVKKYFLPPANGWVQEPWDVLSVFASYVKPINDNLLRFSPAVVSLMRKNGGKIFSAPLGPGGMFVFRPDRDPIYSVEKGGDVSLLIEPTGAHVDAFIEFSHSGQRTLDSYRWSAPKERIALYGPETSVGSPGARKA